MDLDLLELLTERRRSVGFVPPSAGRCRGVTARLLREVREIDQQLQRELEDLIRSRALELFETSASPCVETLNREGPVVRRP